MSPEQENGPGNSQEKTEDKELEGYEYRNNLPPCLVGIDKEGRLWHRGAEMTHPGINSIMLDNIRLDEQGNYVIVFEGQECWVEVEDTALVIQRVSPNEKGLELLLSDGQTEVLNPELLWLSDENVIYTKVRRATMPARFLRQSYYQLAEHIVESESGFALKLNGAKHYIVSGRP